MDMKYLTLRKQLDDLGYKQTFTLECFPLLENITADLLQTTRSLQHYMSLSKEVIKDRDDLRANIDPYICDNTKLVKENNDLHLELLKLREELDIYTKRNKTKIRKLENEVSNLEFDNRNLKIRCRDNELKNLRADTFSSRSKYVTGYSRPCCAQQNKHVKGSDESCSCNKTQCCVCVQLQNQLESNTKRMIEFRDKNTELQEEVGFLQQQIENRNHETVRLRKLLEGGRPIPALQRDCCGKDLDRKLVQMNEQIKEYENKIVTLNSQLKDSLDLQHEAMNRAIRLSDRNNALEKELRNIDQLALKIECDSNENFKSKCDLIESLQKDNDNMMDDKRKLEKELSSMKEEQRRLKVDVESANNENRALKIGLSTNTEIKDTLLKENEMLIKANHKLRMRCEQKSFDKDGLESASYIRTDSSRKNSCSCKDRSKDELLSLLDKERALYERQISEVKKQLAEVNRFSRNDNFFCTTCDKLKQERDFYKQNHYPGEAFVTDLKNKICELEQHIQCLKKQNEVLADNNHSLKMCLEQNNLSQRTGRSHSDVENYLQSNINKLERDLKRAHHDIQNLEEERDHLKSKLKSFKMYDRNDDFLEDNYFSHKMRVMDSANREKSTIIDHLKREIDVLQERLKTNETELLHVRSVNNQLKTLQHENDKNIAGAQTKSYESQREMQMLKEQIKGLEKNKFDLEHECRILKSDKMSLKDTLSKIDQERDKLIMEIDDKTERLSSLEHELRSKQTSVEMLENKIKELNNKMDLLMNSNATFEHRWRDSQTRNEALSIELESIAKQRDTALIENKRLQSDLAAISNDSRTVNREYEVSRKEVEEMKQQLQHYVDEVRRIEDILSRKEAERTEMLDHFASLSHEATVLESNNHSLENESASKSVQLQVTLERLSEIEKKLESREALIDMQEEKMTKLIYNISKLESELTQQKELTSMAEKNLEYARDTCATLEKQKKAILIGVGDNESEKKKLEYQLRILKDERSKLQDNYTKDKTMVESLESLLSGSRREVVELKLRLQESIEETRLLKEKVDQLQERLRKVEGESLSSRQRSEEAARNLHELQWQINDQRFQRVRNTELHQSITKEQHTSTL